MEYVNIRLTRDELAYVLQLFVDAAERAEPSDALDVLDIIKEFLEQSIQEA